MQTFSMAVKALRVLRGSLDKCFKIGKNIVRTERCEKLITKASELHW